MYENAKTWTTAWERLKNLPPGAQANAILARRLRDAKVAFLKELKDQRSSERRARFFREAKALARLCSPGIPALIETNTQYFEDKDYELYIATEFINGVALPSVVSSSDFTPAAAIEIARQLCSILQHAHDNNINHRDIKPDNILITSDGNIQTVHLVDFGVAYIEDTPTSFVTETGQELGNRFLRLPELSSGSANKNDPRSDVAFVAGIFFYMLTSIRPSVLQDDLGHLPHQRTTERARLLQQGLDADRLLQLFDKAFQVEMTQRFQSIEELRQALSRLSEEIASSGVSQATIERIRERLSMSSVQQKTQLNATIKRAVEEVRRITFALARELPGTVIPFQSDHKDDPKNNRSSERVGLRLATNPAEGFVVTVGAKAIGSEIKLAMVSERMPPLIIRFGIDATLTGEELARVRQRFIDELDILTRQDDVEVTNDDLSAFLRSAIDTANGMIEALTQSVIAYAYGRGQSALQGIETPEVIGAKRSGRVALAQSMVLAKLVTTGRYVRFNSFVKVRVPRKHDEQLYSIQELSVTITDGKSGDGPSAAIRAETHDASVFQPTDDQFSDVLRKALDALKTYDPAGARLRRELLDRRVD